MSHFVFSVFFNSILDCGLLNFELVFKDNCFVFIALRTVRNYNYADRVNHMVKKIVKEDFFFGRNITFSNT